MKNYKIILRLLLKDVFKKREGKQVLMFVLLGVLYAAIALVIVSVVAVMGGEAKAAGKSLELTTSILAADFILTIVFGILAAMSLLFMSRDSEFFKTLPVKESQVFLAKLTIVYLTEAILSAILLIPALLTAGIRMDFPLLFFCLIPVFALVVPIFSMLFIALISLPFMFIISKLKNRSTIASIVLIAVFVLGFSLYAYFMLSINSGFSNLGGNGDGGADGNGTELDTTGAADYSSLFKLMTGFSRAFYPLYMLMKFATLTPVFGLSLPLSMVVTFGIFLFSLAGIFSLSMLVCTLVYRKSTGRLLENTAKSLRKGRYFQANQHKTLIKHEWRQIIRSPVVAMQVVSGIVLCPLMVVFFSIMIGNMTTVFSDAEIGMTIDIAPIVWIMGMMSVLMFGVGINTGAATCISREGRGIRTLKSMPIDPNTIIHAKKVTYLLISGISIVTGLVAMLGVMLYYRVFLWWIPVGGLPVALVWLYAMTNLSILADMKSPKLDWKSLREVIKRGKNNLFAIIWILVCLTLSTFLIVLALIGIFTSPAMMIGIGYAILFGLGVGAAIPLHNKLHRKTPELFSNLHI